METPPKENTDKPLTPNAAEGDAQGPEMTPVDYLVWAVAIVWGIVCLVLDKSVTVFSIGVGILFCVELASLQRRKKS